MDTPVKRRAKDLKFSSRFDLPEDETVTRGSFSPLSSYLLLV
jgi:hypothetical protein